MARGTKIRENCVKQSNEKGNVQLDESQQNIRIRVQHFGGRSLLDERLHCKVKDGGCVLFGLELEFAEIVDETVEKLGLEQLVEGARRGKEQNDLKRFKINWATRVRLEASSARANLQKNATQDQLNSVDASAKPR